MEKTMSKIIMTLAAVSALAIAGPAAAQTASSNLDLRVDQLQAEIQAGVRSGTIARSEAPALRQQVRQIRDIERQYSQDGLTRTERQDLRTRVRNLRERLRYAQGTGAGETQYGQSQWIDRNRDGFDDRDYDRDGRWDDDVNTRRYGSADRIDRNRDGFDDRDFDRDGRWDDDAGYGSAYGQGGPYEEVSQVCGSRQGGVAGVIGAILGSDNCLRVGERVTGNLGAIPFQYQGEFRDGSGYYHRYLDGNVVQIDARTGTVARIYDVD